MRTGRGEETHYGRKAQSARSKVGRKGVHLARPFSSGGKPAGCIRCLARGRGEAPKKKGKRKKDRDRKSQKKTDGHPSKSAAAASSTEKGTHRGRRTANGSIKDSQSCISKKGTEGG